jgi:alpha-beta hydrolase superfamily lysophospholipase
VHGWAEHSGRYEHVGAWFAARACAVHAYDHRGHGRSDGPRGHARRFEDLLDDLELALARVRAQDPGLPVFLVGHSMGGLLVASFVIERVPEIAGAVTSGVALALAGAPPRARLNLLRLLGRVAPRLAVARPIAPEALSRDPEVGRAYLEDPLVLRRMTLGFGAELLARVGRTAGGAGGVRVPMLLLHGGDDPLCPVEGSRRFFAGLGAPASDLRVYPGLRHEIFNEPEREVVFTDLLAWLRDVAAARLGSPALGSAPAPRVRAGEAGLAG